MYIIVKYAISFNYFKGYYVNNNPKTIFEELDALARTKNSDGLIETRGMNIVEGAINLIALMRSQLTESEALDMERRLLNSIRSGDSKKFKRGMARIKKTRRLSQDK